MEKFGNGKVVCCVPAFFCVFAYRNDYRYAKEVKEYELHQKKLLPTVRLPKPTFLQEAVSSHDHQVDPYSDSRQASRTTTLAENVYPHLDKTGFGVSLELGCLQTKLANLASNLSIEIA